MKWFDKIMVVSMDAMEGNIQDMKDILCCPQDVSRLIVQMEEQIECEKCPLEKDRIRQILETLCPYALKSDNNQRI